MRKFLICVVAALLAGCLSAPGEEIGIVRMKTDGQGRLARVHMIKSTGSAAMDRRVVLFARNTFAKYVPEALPNHIYEHSVRGEVTDYPGEITVWKARKK